MNPNKKRKLIKDLKIELLQVGDEIKLLLRVKPRYYCVLDELIIVGIYKNTIHLQNSRCIIKLPKSQIVIRNNNLCFFKKYTMIKDYE